MSNAWTIRRIKDWLRRYPDWRKELDDESVAVGSSSALEGSQVRKARLSDPTARAAARIEVLGERCRTVERWMAGLSRIERIAACYWMGNGDVAINQVAEEAKLKWHQARELVIAVPAIILSRIKTSE